MARGLAPVGSRSGPQHFSRLTELPGFTTAAQPNGGKPPRHKSPLPQGLCGGFRLISVWQRDL
ncbi:hypothetical protein BZL43_25085 [Pseudomonas sp. PICF141]|nr:hypothetical protein BZL43_25085 [Pseudomonas sp. PICF141]